MTGAQHDQNGKPKQSDFRDYPKPANRAGAVGTNSARSQPSAPTSPRFRQSSFPQRIDEQIQGGCPCLSKTPLPNHSPSRHQPAGQVLLIGRRWRSTSPSAYGRSTSWPAQSFHQIFRLATGQGGDGIRLISGLNRRGRNKQRK